MTTSTRAEREIRHGQRLAAAEPERIWGWSTPAGQRRARRRARLIALGAGLGPGVRALEIGCGTGLFTEQFAATGANIVAVDLSDDLLERARRRRLDPERVRFVTSRIEDFGDPGGFDAVIGSSVLHHLDLDAALPAVRCLLRPHGLLSFAEPNYLNPQIFLERRIPFLRRWLHVSPDEAAFVRWMLARGLERHGFTNVRIAPFDWLHPFTPSALIAIVERVGAFVERLPIAREFAGSLQIVASRA